MFADYGTSQALSCPWGNMLDHRKRVDDDMRKRNDNAGRHTIQSSKRKNVQLVRRLKITQLGETLFEPCTQPLCIPELGKHVFYATPSVGVIFGHLARALPLRHIKKHFHSFTAFFFLLFCIFLPLKRIQSGFTEGILQPPAQRVFNSNLLSTEASLWCQCCCFFQRL